MPCRALGASTHDEPDRMVRLRTRVTKGPGSRTIYLPEEIANATSDSHRSPGPLATADPDPDDTAGVDDGLRLFPLVIRRCWCPPATPRTCSRAGGQATVGARLSHSFREMDQCVAARSRGAVRFPVPESGIEPQVAEAVLTGEQPQIGDLSRKPLLH